MLALGFFVLFAVLSLQFSPESVAKHQLYIKEHKVRAERGSHRPLDRTLFVLNIPPYCSEVQFMIIHSFGALARSICFADCHCCSPFQDVVKELFSQFGCVQSVELRDHPGSSQESGPTLSKFFKAVAKQVTSVCCNISSFLFRIVFYCLVILPLFWSFFFPPRGSKWATSCSRSPPV